MFQAIAKTIRKSKLQVNLSPSLRKEISHWKFLDSWDGFLKWKQEFHLQVHAFSDASNTGWGGSLPQRGKSPLETRGYWDTTERKLPIFVKEALALLRTLENILHTHSNTRIDAFVDNKAVLASWDKQVSKSPIISCVMKSIFQFVFKRNILLSLYYVPSKENPANSPSRTLSELDCSLSKDAWKCAETAFAPHSIDLMALPENVRRDRSRRPLLLFSHFPCFQALGTNVSFQHIQVKENAYVFPPFVLVGPLIKHLSSVGSPYTIVVPDLIPRIYWWPLPQQSASAVIQVRFSWLHKHLTISS